MELIPTESAADASSRDVMSCYFIQNVASIQGIDTRLCELIHKQISFTSVTLIFNKITHMYKD